MANPDEKLPPGVTAEMLEKFRNLITMDKECNWYFDGRPITHERTLKVLSESLQRNAQGRLIVQVGNAWSYVSAEDAPYVVRAVREDGDAPPRHIALILSDGTRERLDPATLAVGKQNVLYARVKGGREWARFLRPAYYQIAAHIVEEPAGGGSFALTLADGRHRIARREEGTEEGT